MAETIVFDFRTQSNHPGNIREFTPFPRKMSPHLCR